MSAMLATRLHGGMLTAHALWPQALVDVSWRQDLLSVEKLVLLRRAAAACGLNAARCLCYHIPA